MTTDLNPLAPPPPPPPPFPPSGPAGNPFPWEDRARLGFVNAYIGGVRELLTAPAAAFARMRERGDYASPLLFAIVSAIFGALFSGLWSFAVKPTNWLAMLPGDLGEQAGAAAAIGVGGFFFQLILVPIMTMIGLLIGAGITHLFLLLFGGLQQSPSGFEGTFRVVGYSSVTQLANLVPIVGPLAGTIWAIVLLVLGLARLHRTTQGRALAAVFAPLVLCCACVLFAAILAGGLIAGAIKGAGGF